MVDAEHSYFQPAIDHAVLEMQRKYNTTVPIIFNTYQCYTKVSGVRIGHQRVPMTDMCTLL